MRFLDRGGVFWGGALASQPDRGLVLRDQNRIQERFFKAILGGKGVCFLPNSFLQFFFRGAAVVVVKGVLLMIWVCSRSTRGDSGGRREKVYPSPERVWGMV